MSKDLADSKYQTLLNFCKANKIQKHINKIAQKHKNKKILIYGAGLFFKILQENLDLSGLNIVGVTDRSFSEKGIYGNIISLPISDIEAIDFDIVIIATMMPRETELFIRNHEIFRHKKFKIEYFNTSFRKLNPFLNFVKEKISRIKSPTKSGLIVFYTEKFFSESLRYRVYNICEGLKRKGIKTKIIFEHEAYKLEELKDFIQILVVFRSKDQNFVNLVLPKLKNRKFPIIADIDDYIFNPKDVNYLGEIENFQDYDMGWYIEQLKKYKTIIENCDYATATTDFLATKIKELGIDAKVIKNTINPEQLKLANKINQTPKKNTNIIKIGYMSGTKTHNKDFKEASDAIYEILEKYQNIEFHIVGFLDLEEKFDKFKTKIKYKKFMPYLKMLKYLSKMDINIAPLELNNPFTAGKSELKIFEAALVKIPSIVSEVDSYAKYIKNETNGFLANSKEDWLKYLTLLIENSEIRKRIAEQAYADFLELFYIDKEIDNIIETYNEFIKIHKEKYLKEG